MSGPNYCMWSGNYVKLNTLKHRLVLTRNKIYIPPWHPCTVTPTPIYIDLFLFLPWLSGQQVADTESRATHTLDIYKTTNHWNPRNAVFHFRCQTSCHADHTAVTQPSKLSCTPLSFCSFTEIFFLIHFPFSHSILFLLIELFINNLSLSLFLSHLYLYRHQLFLF